MIACHMDVVDASALTTADVPVVAMAQTAELRKWARPEKSAAGFHWPNVLLAVP
jgi:hypothetical protein